MGSDAEVFQFFKIQEEFSCSELGSNTAGRESGPDGDGENQRLQDALTRNMPMIRRRIEAVASHSDWSFHDYLERLYKRLRSRLSGHERSRSGY